MDSDDEELTREALVGQFMSVNSNGRKPPAPRQFKTVIEIVVPTLPNEDEYKPLPPEAYWDSEDDERSEDELVDTGSATARSHRARRQPTRRKSNRSRAIRDRGGFIDPGAILLSDDEQPLRPRRKSTRRVIGSEQDYTPSNSSTRRSQRISSQLNLIDPSDLSDDMSQRPRKKLRTGGSLRQRSKRLQNEESTGTRFSRRQKVVHNMAERFEDDIPDREAPVASTKYSGAREQFSKLSKDDPFRKRHRPICSVCSSHGDNNEKGVLVFCQGCTGSYHEACLGPRGTRPHLVTKISATTFILQCRWCLGHPREKDPLAPHHGHCSTCSEPGLLSRPLRNRLTTRQEHLQREENGGTDPMIEVDMSLVNSVQEVMFRCAKCERAWHMDHLPPKLPPPAAALDDEDIRFKEYSRRWRCNECANTPGEVEALVSWRPLDLDSYIPGQPSDAIEEAKKEYLVKWRKLSYFRTSWMPGAWIWGFCAGAMRRAFQNSSKNLKPMMTSEDAIPEEFLQIDIILDVRYSNVVSNTTQAIDMARAKEVDEVYAKYKGLRYEDAVWEKPPGPQGGERWQSFRTAYEDWVRGNYMHLPRAPSLKKHLTSVRSRDFATNLLKSRQPSILTGGELMEYQKDGLNWLYYMWYKQNNAILADEMGLGKTIQVIAFFATLIQDHHCWPFLVVVPNSTCPNWRQEVKTWAPTLRVVTYFGSSQARRLAHDYEMFLEDDKDLRAHIVVTSYETMIDDKAKRIFSSVPWAGLVVDEGHRLKNDKNQLYTTLSNIRFPFKILLTGTPLQNNVRELFNILQFCDPSKNAEDLESQYQDMSKESVAELHEMIRPFILRRTKAQVLNFLPPVAQIIVPISMTVVQKKLYKSILERNTQLIKSIFKSNESVKKNERQNLNNILVQLRKCLTHPFVYSKAIEEQDVGASLLHRNLVEASSKLQLLELLLPKLQERGHRVLIFSQFLDFLDITEDFLDGLGLLHLRLDGSMSSLQKQKRIDAFNAPNSPYFAFLLSTRAGGVGINLASADTVIITDPDFNPHQDIQALSRAHRIGQQKKVLVFQLMTRGSAEEKIMQIGRKKMALDHVLIDRLDAEDDAGEDVESILRHGAEALFSGDNSADIQYDAQSVEKLLDRSHTENTKTGNDASAESQFSYARVWVNDSAAMEDQLGSSVESVTPNSNVWDKILQERERNAEEAARAKRETLGRGKRRRHAIDYTLASPHHTERQGDNDDEFQSANGDWSSGESGITSVQDSPRSQSARARPYKRANLPPPRTTFDGAAVDLTETGRCPACDEFHETGHCRLKLAGVEHCGLCGIAHYGQARTCPHLNSEAQVASMLGSLKQSTEPRAFIDEATKYLRGIRGDLVRRKKLKANKAAAGNSGQPSSSAGPDPQPPTFPIPPQSHPSQPLNGQPHPQYVHPIPRPPY